MMKIETHPSKILTINRGSSSLKFSLYEIGSLETLIFKGEIERIGLGNSLFQVRSPEGKNLVSASVSLTHHQEALQVFLEWFDKYISSETVDAVGHRIVHGGAAYRKPHLITEELMSELQKLTSLDPDHLPYEIQAVNIVSEFYPGMKQVACFDTAFHRSLPKIAQLYPLPRELGQEGVLRYGFHGLSCEFVMSELAKEGGPTAAKGRVVIAHLGNGASMTAVYDGKSVETTMGFTPTGGLMMSTRSGDLDPGVVLYLLQQKAMTSAEVRELLNRRAGLRGVSGITSDMKDLLEKEGEESSAHEAIDLFCYTAKKSLAALTAALGGLDALVFTGGIGENSPVIRSRICENLEFLGILLDPALNKANAPVVSREKSSLIVHVIKTNEELMIARHTYSLLRGLLGQGPDTKANPTELLADYHRKES